jgi:hypothetical protein
VREDGDSTSDLSSQYRRAEDENELIEGEDLSDLFVVHNLEGSVFVHIGSIVRCNVALPKSEHKQVLFTSSLIKLITILLTN